MTEEAVEQLLTSRVVCTRRGAEVEQAARSCLAAVYLVRHAKDRRGVERRLWMGGNGLHTKEMPDVWRPCATCPQGKALWNEYKKLTGRDYIYDMKDFKSQKDSNDRIRLERNRTLLPEGP